MSHPLLDKYRK